MRLRILAAAAAFAAVGLASSVASAQCGHPMSNSVCWATLACVDPGSTSSPNYGMWHVENACYAPDRTEGQPCTWVNTRTGEVQQVVCETVAPDGT